MARTGPTNPRTIELLFKLKQASLKNDAPVWKSLYKSLSKPTRKRIEVNLSKIERFAKEGDTILVPGVLLGSGKLTKKVTISAFRASGSALQKIKKAGAKYLTIDELLKKHPKGKEVRILG